MTDDMVLEELEEEPQVKRRKLRNVFDEITELSSDYVRLQIDNNNVESRRVTERVVAPPAIHPLSPPQADLPSELLTGAAQPLSSSLTTMQWSRLRQLETRAWDTHVGQEAVKHLSNMKSSLEKIDEEAETVFENYEGNLKLRDVSKQMDTTDVIVQVAPEVGAAAAGRTQASPETRRPEQHVGEELLSPKRRRCGYVSFHCNLERSLEPSILETNNEKFPRVQDPSALLTSGADSSERENETPLGSLDRTMVSLGDSENTMDIKKFLRDEWGTQGVMNKIYHSIKSGSSPVNVHSLLSDGPVLSGQRRLIAAHCFTSILKLKQHSLIRIDKDSETNEIKDIKFGRLIDRDPRISLDIKNNLDL